MTSNDLPPMNRKSSGGVSGDADHDELERLNRYLDGVARDCDLTDEVIDPGLTATVRAVHALAALDAREIPTSAEQARLWRRLVQLPGMEVTPDPRSSTGSRLGIVRGIRPIPGPAPVAGWPRLVATLAAVLVLVLTALSLYQRLPGGASTPTVMAAGYATSPAGVEATVSASPVITTATGDARSGNPPSAACRGTPAGVDHMRGTVIGPGEPDQHGLPRTESSPTAPAHPGARATPWNVCNLGIR